MDVLQNRGLYTASLLFGFVPVELYLRVSGNDDFQQKLTAFSQLRVLLTTFLKNVTLLMDHVPDNDDSHFLELTAHMASFVTLLRRLLRVDNIEVLENCFSLLMVLTSGLPASVINSIKEFLIAAIFQRLDSQHENVRKSIQILSSMLCKRLPVHLVIEFVNLQINCQCASTKRKLIDVLTTIILENRTIPKKPKPLLWKLAQLMLDCEIQVRIAALECLAAIFSLMSLSVTDFVNNIATNFPPSIDVCTKKKILRCIKERIKVNEPPKLRPDGLLEYNLNDLKAKTSELPITAGLRTKKDCNSNVNATYNEISRSPPRIYPRRTALQRNRRPNCSYLDHFSALQKFQNISRPCQASRAALTRSTDEETGTSIPLRKSTSFINESTEKVTQNTYAFITRKKSTKENKSNFMEWNSVPSCSFDTSEEIGGSVVLRRCHSALSTEDRDYEGLVSLSQIAESIMSIKCSASKRLDSLRSRISRSKNCEGQPTERQPLKALVLLEKTQAWAQKSQALFTQTNVHQNYAGDVTEIVTKESRETSTRMSSGYASEDVNQAVSVLPHDEVITGKNTNATFSNPWQPMIPVSAIGTHIRPRLRKTKLTSPMRSRTVHWASRPFHAVDRDAISSVDDLTSTNWQDQHCALQCLSGFLRSDVPSQEHELRKWSPGKIQQLCSGLVFTTSSLRSQISRMAITIIKSTIRQLSPSQLEPVTMKLFFGLISRVGGDASSSFLRTEACEAISLLVSQASPFIIVTCLNDACHSIQARSVAGRRCLAHCYASVLPRLLPPKASLSKASDKPIGTGKRKDIFDKILFHVVSFLRDGDLETRTCAKKVLQILSTIPGFETHYKVALNEHDRNAVNEILDKLANSKTFETSLKPADGLRHQRRLRSQPPPYRSPPVGKVHLSLCEADSSRRSDWHQSLLSLHELGTRLLTTPVTTDLSTSELVKFISPMISDENDKVARAALKLCLDARQLDLRNSGGRKNQEKFCPGLLSLLYERQDVDGFARLLTLIYLQLDSDVTGVSDLSRNCLDETLSILGPEALVKPLLQAIHNTSTNVAGLVGELCGITAEIDVESPIVRRYLLPEVSKLLIGCNFHPAPDQKPTEEQTAVISFVRCLSNLVGSEVVFEAARKEGVEQTFLIHIINS